MEKTSIRITIDVFSGRENPVIELTGEEAREVMKRLEPGSEIKKNELGLPPEPKLGYRGLIIENVGEYYKGLPKLFRYVHGDIFGPDFAYRASDVSFEDFFCGSTGPISKLKMGDEFSKLLFREIENFRDLRLKYEISKVRLWWKWLCWPWWPWYWLYRCRCAPLFEADWWNNQNRSDFKKCSHNDDYTNYYDNPDRYCPFFRWDNLHPDEWFNIQHLNNCYNYATNYRTETFAQPGRGANGKYTSLTCDAVKTAAIMDDLIDMPDMNNKCPKEGHLVALVVAPGWDYHWYRKDRYGYWSHKPGQTAATNLDNNGNKIRDPRTAERGSYTEFCTFMIVKHGHIKIL